MPTLTAYRQKLAQEIGEYWGSTSAASSGVANLIDLKWPIHSSVASPQTYDVWYILRPNAVSSNDLVRTVQAYTGSQGSLQPDTAWTNAPISESYELHGLLEPGTVVPRVINEALKRCMVIREETIANPIQQNIRQVYTPTIPLDDVEWIRQVGVLAQGESRDLVDPYARPIRGEVTIDDTTDTIYLNTPGVSFASTDTIYIKRIARAYDCCSPNGSAPWTQAGLALETEDRKSVV